MGRFASAVFLFALAAVAQEPGGGLVAPVSADSAEASVFSGRFRLCALLGSGTEIVVGLTDSKTEQAYLLRSGEQIEEYKLLYGDYDNETATFERDGHPFTVSLKGDADAAARSAEDVLRAQENSKQAALKQFVSEHPDLRMADGSRVEVPPDAMEADGSFEAFVRRYGPQAGDDVTEPPPFGQSPPAGLPETIPTNASTSPPVVRASDEEIMTALKSMAEQTGMAVPTNALKPVTYEEFLEQHKDVLSQTNDVLTDETE